jgi:hypothetical protein
MALCLGAAGSALGQEASTATPLCYDAIVRARIVRQLPTAIPDCGPDCIVMSWPWFMDLNVKRAEVGAVPRGRLQTLIVLHASYRTDLGYRRWWLRRNTLGGYNVLRFGDGENPERCPSNSLPAKAYIEPRPGQTLDELRTESKRNHDAE